MTNQTIQFLINISFVKSIPNLEFNGMTFPGTLSPEAFPYEGQRGRITAQTGGPGANLTPGGSSFFYSNEIQVSPCAPLQFDFTKFTPATPAGYENKAPGNHIQIAFRDFGQTDTDFFVELLHQVSGEVTYASGARESLHIDGIEVGPGPFPNSYQVFVSGMVPGEPLPDLATRPESADSFAEALASAHMQTGRPYYFTGLGRWVVPIRVAIRDADGAAIAVMTAGYAISDASTA